MQVVVDGTLVNYIDEGRGRVLLCVHGWMHSGESFRQLIAELKDNYRIVAIDLPNFGKSQMTDQIITIDNYALFLQKLIDKLGIKEYIYIGHSMGGQIGMRAVGHGVISPDKLILISSAGVRDERRMYKAFLKFMSGVLKYIVPKVLKARFYSAIGSDYNPDLSEVHKNIINQTLRDDVQKDAAEIKIPTLLINGSEDSSTPLWMAKKLQAQIADSQLEVVDGEHHWPHQTASEKVAAIIKRFAS